MFSFAVAYYIQKIIYKDRSARFVLTTPQGIFMPFTPRSIDHRANPFGRNFPHSLNVRRLKSLTSSIIDELRAAISALDGTVLLPGVDPAADTLLPFNLRTRLIPTVIVSCLTPKGVGVSLEWATRHNIPLSAHSGGHSYEGFSSSLGIMIDVRPMNQVSYNPKDSKARVGAGIKLLDLVNELAKYGVAIPLGSCAPVGIAGLTLGGGHGVSSRKYGLTLDNLVAADVVLADGTSVSVDKNHYSDLFWALRGGGGGNFGIVTGFSFQVHKVSQVCVFHLAWKVKETSKALKAWQQFVLSAPDELGSVLVLSGSGNRISSVACSGQLLPNDGSSVPDLAHLRTLLGPLLRISHTKFEIKTMDYVDAASYFAVDGDKVPVFFKAKSSYITGALNQQAEDTLLKALSNTTSAVDVIFEAYGGAINRVATNATAFPHRGNTAFCLQYFAQWNKPSQTAAETQTVTDVFDAMSPHVSGRSYVNYIDIALANWQSAYYGANLKKLIAIKCKYDPTDTFHFPPSIPLR